MSTIYQLQTYGLEHPFLTLLAGGGIYLAYLIWYHRDGSALGTVPRPDLDTMAGGWPLLGNLLQMASEDRILEKYLVEKTKGRKGGKPFSMCLPFMRTIDVSSPDYLEYIQKTNFGNYEKGKLQAGFMRSTLGGGIFATDGEKWQTQRKATSKIFSTNNFRGIISESIEKDLVKLRKIIGDKCDSGEPFDLAALFFAFTLSSFTSLAFGQDVGSLDSETPVPFAVAFDFAQHRMDKRSVNPLWPVLELFTKDGRKMRQANKVISDFAYDIIDKRTSDSNAEKKANGGEKGETATDLLSLYTALRDEKGQALGREALRDSVINLVIAGRDTTAQALSWTYFHLLSNPHYFADLRKEVDAMEEVNYDTFKDLINTSAAFNEGLRLHPSVPKNVWTAKSADQLPNNGPLIQKDDKVFWNDWAMGRDTTLWGEDAADFKPERWVETVEGEEKVKKESMWKWHVFNGGQRLCVGQNLALYEATAVMATITREFDLKFAPGWLDTVEMIDIGTKERTPRYCSSLTLPMNAPFMVTATRRQA